MGSARWLWLVAGVAIAAIVIINGRQPSPAATQNESPGSSLSALLAEQAAAAFSRADRPDSLVFPRDHGPHPGYQNEWWYLTGNLYSTNGDRFGFQWTFFRRQLTPESSRPESTNDIYMAHFALTDVANQQFHFQEKFARPEPATGAIHFPPLQLIIDDWSLEAATDNLWPLRLSATDRQRHLQLQLQPSKPLVLQGDRGLSQKSNERGNASYYYSYTRLAARGKLTISDRTHTVSGSAWLDREWSTSALGEDQAGWDWFALQFDDGRDLMFYRLRRKDGSVDPLSRGVLVDDRGQSLTLTDTQLQLQPLAYWQSPAGNRYPIHWRYALGVEGQQQQGEIRAVIEPQWLNASVRYWEGAVTVFDSADQPIGVGYLEMTGY